MNGFVRVFPHLWPFRRKLFLSIAFGLMVAFFWGFNLSAVLPVVEVLFSEKTLVQYVDEHIAQLEQDIDHRNSMLAAYDDELTQLEASQKLDDGARARISRQKAGEVSRLNSSSRKLQMFTWVKSYVMPHLPTDRFDTFAAILGVLFVATVIKGICIVIQDVLVGSMVELTTMSIRKECFRHTLGLDYQTLSLAGTPDLMSRFTYDMTVLADGLRLVGGKLIREPLKAMVCICAAWFLVSWQLTLLSMLFAPLAGYVLYHIGRTMKKASHRLMESMSRIYKTLEESFESAKIVIAFGGAQQHRQRFHRENKEYLAKSLKLVRFDALTSPTTEVLGMLAAFIAVLPGAYLVLRKTTSIWGIQLVSDPIGVSDLAMLYAFLAGVIDPARKLSSLYTKLKRSSAAADRIFTLVDTQSKVIEAAKPKPLARLSREIEFRNVTFSYSSAPENTLPRAPVLQEVSLRVTAGEVIVVVGENGSGKSTLVNLLPRFFDPSIGSVLIDGMDIREAPLRQLRQQIGIVTQETLLFDRSIYDNIRYGKPNATRAEVEQAALNAHVTPFVAEFPEGFDTGVGEKGGRLSGGQRQRIALARAMLRDPAILILDEATSAIDAQSENLIYQALRQFVRGRTTFIITHSITQSCLDFVTRIVVMDQGRFVAAGTHHELLQSSAVYRDLYGAQSLGEFSEQPSPIVTDHLPRVGVVQSSHDGHRRASRPSTITAHMTESGPTAHESPEPEIFPFQTNGNHNDGAKTVTDPPDRREFHGRGDEEGNPDQSVDRAS